jgi:hypothetical protein
VPFREITPKLPTGPFGIIIGIVQFILQLFGLGGVDLKPLSDAINNTWANLAVAGAFLYNAIGRITDFLKKLISILIDGLKHIISDILHGHLLAALKDIQAMFHAIHELFKPIIDEIIKLRGYYYKYIFKWVKRIEDVLSIVRVILSAFRILGFKWAAKLDADIQRLQGYITSTLQGIIAPLNLAITWLNFITDPTGIFRKDVFNGTLFNTLPQLWRALSFGKDRQLTASQAQEIADDRGMTRTKDGVLTRNADGSVTYSAAAIRQNDRMDAAWDFYGLPAR